jgi:hypothetical protein
MGRVSGPHGAARGARGGRSGRGVPTYRYRGIGIQRLVWASARSLHRQPPGHRPGPSVSQCRRHERCSRFEPWESAPLRHENKSGSNTTAASRINIVTTLRLKVTIALVEPAFGH